MSMDDGACEKHIVVAEEELLELPLPTYRCEFCGLNVKTRANLRAHHVKTHRILKSDSDVAFYTKQRCKFTYVYHCPVVPCRHNIGGGAGFSTSSRLKQLVKLEQQPVETTNPCISLEVSQYDFACQFDNSFPSSETGTQTEAASFSQELTPLEASAPSVSVNTCTDEDDISAFIGSLFCDASVETRYPRPHLVHEFTDTGLDVLDPASIEVATTDELSLPVQYLVGDNLLDIPGDDFISSNDNGVVPCITDNLCDTALSEGTALHPNAHAEVQTDLKSKSHAAAATHDTPFYWNSGTDLRRSILITPPLLSDGPVHVPTTAGSQLHQRVERSLTTSSLSRHAYKLDPYAAPLDLTSQPLNSCTSNAEYCTFGADYRPYLFSPGISPGALSSHSVGLQSTPWPPAPLCSSIASQTLTDDWESWLNSVHTQTNTSPLSLTDMCIGANDEFLPEPFEQSANMNDVASLINQF